MSESQTPPEGKKVYRRFSEFVKDGPLDGDKMKIEDILNREILIRDFRLKKSKFKEGTKPATNCI